MKYDDIINLPHFHAKGHPYMSNVARAAQFMPFKSLKGYDELVDQVEAESNRPTEYAELLDADTMQSIEYNQSSEYGMDESIIYDISIEDVLKEASKPDNPIEPTECNRSFS